jgi:hypothetical protein
VHVRLSSDSPGFFSPVGSIKQDDLKAFAITNSFVVQHDRPVCADHACAVWRNLPSKILDEEDKAEPPTSQGSRMAVPSPFPDQPVAKLLCIVNARRRIRLQRGRVTPVGRPRPSRTLKSVCLFLSQADTVGSNWFALDAQMVLQ